MDPIVCGFGELKIKYFKEQLWSPERIYKWNKWRWEHFSKSVPGYNPIQIKETTQVIGGQMCSWEQSGDARNSVLRKRLPVFRKEFGMIIQVSLLMKYFQLVERTDKILSLIITNDNRQDSILVGYNFKKKIVVCGVIPNEERRKLIKTEKHLWCYMSLHLFKLFLNIFFKTEKKGTFSRARFIF